RDVDHPEDVGERKRLLHEGLRHDDRIDGDRLVLVEEELVAAAEEPDGGHWAQPPRSIVRAEAIVVSHASLVNARGNRPGPASDRTVRAPPWRSASAISPCCASSAGPPRKP